MSTRAFFYIHNVIIPNTLFFNVMFLLWKFLDLFYQIQVTFQFFSFFWGFILFLLSSKCSTVHFCKLFNFFQWFKKCYHQMKIIAIIQGQRFLKTFCIWIMITDVHQKELYLFYISNGSIYSYTNVSLLLEP